MANSVTEKKGLDAVIRHERNAGRIARRVHKVGYDLISEGNGEVRHIEVKATAKLKFTWRWLEEKEYAALQKDPLFWVYLVTDTNGKQTIIELDAVSVKKRETGKIIHYKFNFS